MECNNPIGARPKQTFLMDFTMARRKGEGIQDMLFFSTKFSHPKERYVDHLRIMKEATFKILLNNIGYDH